MDTEETTLEIFLRDRMKEKGVSLKKLSDITGIAVNHIENMLRGDFGRIPSTPYFRGYLIRIGEVLGFDGEAWWRKIKKEEEIKKSGPTDALPKNRFAREFPVKTIVISAAVLIILIVFGFALPHIQGKPVIIITSPQNNSSTTSNNILIQGTVKNADSLYVNTDEVVIASDGSWQKNVSLSPTDPNNFDISAKKFLGGTTDVYVKDIIYNPPPTASTTASSSPTSTESR
jgi:cytoskeletal protein RodZ